LKPAYLFGEPEYSVACSGDEGFVHCAALVQPLRTQIPGNLLRLTLFLIISIIFVSCGSLKYEIEIPEKVPPQKSPLPEAVKPEEIKPEEIKAEAVKPEIYDSLELGRLFAWETGDLVYKILFPSYSIIETPEQLPEDPILRIIELKKRYYTYNDVSESDFTDDEISSVFADSNYYYLGTIRGGVFRYSLSGDGFLELTSPYESIVNLSITDIDKTDEKLIITSFSGLYTYNFKDKTFRRESTGSKNENFTSLCVVGQSVFLGTVDGRLLLWEKNNFTEIQRINNNVISVIEYVNGRILLGTSHSGLYEYIPETGVISLVESVNSQLVDGKITFISYFDDKYWIGAAGDGLLVFDNDLIDLLAAEKNIWFLSSCHSDNTIYFGTHRDGVLFYDIITEKTSSWGIKDGLSSLYIPSLYQDNGSIFISTPDKGIVIISEKIHE